jgi:uncharacterized membrane protein
MSWLRRNAVYLLLLLAVAGSVHAASVIFLPRAIMTMAMNRIGAGGNLNAMQHGRRPDETARGVVRPSPDLLYSTCAYDLSKTGALWVQASDMPDTYWSISVFDADSNNIYVIDDRQAKGARVQFLVVGPDWDKPMPYPIVHSPSVRGLVLVRTLIDSDARLAAIDAGRRHARCAAYGTIAPWPPGRG